jgi:hypothetical protein
MIRHTLTLLCALTVCAATSALAHTVWIEPSEGLLVARFAEPGNDFETSPGYLDSLSPLLAFKLVTNAPVTMDVPKKSDRFLLSGAATTNVVGLETIFTVRGGRKPHFYARWQPTGGGAGRPLLTLDLVPTGKSGEVRAYFRGQPLPNIKATLRAPDEKETELTADSEGYLHFEAKQSGQYLLTIAHYREPLAGFHRGVAYQETSHNTALTWRQAQ